MTENIKLRVKSYAQGAGISIGSAYGTMERFVHVHPNSNYHNSNAQVEPYWRRYIPLEFRRDIPMPRISGIETRIECCNDTESDAKQFSEYREREKSEDEYDGVSDDDYGRRSSCSLSDETSSMSETELSTVDDCDTRGEEIRIENTATPTGQPSNLDDNDKKPRMLTCEDIERELYAENSSADDTLTDLTTDSFNLSAMDSCFMESELSDAPEISALDISGVDLSYEQQDSSDLAKNENPSKAPTNPEPVDIIQKLAAVNGITKSVDNKTLSKKVQDTERGNNKSIPKEADTQNEAMVYQNTNVDANPLPNSNLQNDVCQPVIEYCQQCCSQKSTCYCLSSADTPVSYPTDGAGQNQYFFPETPQQQWDPSQQMYPCGSQNSFNIPFVAPEWQNSTPCYPQTYPPRSQTESYNTVGLLTAEQYYAGQQTPLDPVASDPGIEHTVGCTNPPVDATTDTTQAAADTSRFPSLYVSDAGLITVVLNHDVFVELTIDKTVRVVSHERGLVIATNNRGSSNCLYHPHAKLYHEGTKTEVELSDERRVKMSTENILIAKGDKCYRFDYNDVQSAKPDFRDISEDNSVGLLFGSSGYGPSLIPQCTELVQKSKYEYKEDGSFRVRINDISITQNNRGDVTVLCGPKFLKMAPLSCYLRLQTHFIDMAVYKNAKMFVRRGTHSLDSNPTNLRVDNGNLEAEFEDGEDISVVRLPRRTPLKAFSRRQKQKGGGARSRRSNNTPRPNR